MTHKSFSPAIPAVTLPALFLAAIFQLSLAQSETPAIDAQIQTIELGAATVRGNVPQIEALLAQGANINAPDSEGKPALHHAQNRPDLIAALLKNGADVHIEDNKGETLLFTLAWYPPIAQTIESLELLLKHGAKINHQNKDGFTVLMLAAKQGNTPTVELLLKNGADRTIKDNHNRTALSMAWLPDTIKLLMPVEDGQTDSRAQYELNAGLESAITQQNLELVATYLNKGARLDAGNPKASYLLNLVANLGNFKIVQLLVAHGADPRQVDSNGFSALPVYANEQSLEIIKFLVEKGADPTNPNFVAMFPVSAAQVGDLEALKYLKSLGIDMNQPRALIVAAQAGHTATEQWLRAQGTVISGVWSTVALEAAIQAGDSKRVIELFEAGKADLKDPTYISYTLFWEATATRQKAIVSYLVRKGYRPNKKVLVLAALMDAMDVPAGEALNSLLAAIPKGNKRTMERQIALNGALYEARAYYESMNSGRSHRPGEVLQYVKTLVAQGADLNAQLKFSSRPLTGEPAIKGTTPLMKLAGDEYLDTQEFLRSKGAKIDLTDSSGNSALAHAGMFDPKTVRYMISWAKEDGVLSKIIDSALSSAIGNTTNVEITRFLLGQGANPNARNRYTGSTPLMGAMYNPHPTRMDIVALLLEIGGDPKLTDKAGYSALTHALFNPIRSNTTGQIDAPKNIELIKMLFQSGAVVKQKDLEMARQHSAPSIIQLVMDHGGKRLEKQAKEKGVLATLKGRSPDVDDYGKLLGLAKVCGVETTQQQEKVTQWTRRTYAGKSFPVEEYLSMLFEEMDKSRQLQEQGESGATCAEVKKMYGAFPWPK